MTPFETLERLRARSAEALLAQSGLNHPALHRHLRGRLAGVELAEGALIGEPVLEGAHPFLQAPERMGDLAGALLNRRFVEELDALPSGNDYRFPAARRPFRHQLEAWRRLLAPGEPQSVLVTSGTGSGKTECFLFPILSDLAAQAERGGAALTGVQAIMLYPLNALIESQRERLSAWTAPFRGKLRYALYNGDLPEEEREAARRETPEQVRDRAGLRAQPPPVLVTNVTMLEYMLARAQDRPILEASQGKLKWIVLDEAHSLVGARAAEIALLLRRVLLAFGAAPEQVRFVATSATIGSGERAMADLRRFLADVAGAPLERVHVIEGARRPPRRPEGPPASAAPLDPAASPEALYARLGADPEVWALAERLFGGSLPLPALAPQAARLGVKPGELAMAMARAERRDESGEPERLAPLRIHAFERASPGIWSCLNPGCAASPEGWEFGRLFTERAEACPDCSAPVLSLLTCGACGEPLLEGEEEAVERRLRAPRPPAPRDEFAEHLEAEAGATEGEEEAEKGPEAPDSAEPPSPPPPPAVVWRFLLAARPSAAARPLWIDRRGWAVADGPSEHALELRRESPPAEDGPRACPCCGEKGEALQPLRFGAPFLLGVAAPLLLEGVAPSDPPPAPASDEDAKGPPEPLPSEGRRLLSFTDSRQGTARMAARLQIETERNFVRSFLHHQVQASMRPAPGDAEQAARIRAEIQALEPAAAGAPALQGLLAQKRQELEALEQGGAGGILWTTLRERLAERVEVSPWMADVWAMREPELFSDPLALAEFLMLREFDRRPKRANSLETLGLARLRHPAIDRLEARDLPAPLKDRGKTIADWRAWLDAVLTHVLRGSSCVAVRREIFRWLSPFGRLRGMIGPDETSGGDRSVVAWPNGGLRANPRNRAVGLLLAGLNLKLDDRLQREELAECLDAGWRLLQRVFSPDPEHRRLDFARVHVAPLREAWLCPLTRRLLDAAPFGLTPYGLDAPQEARRRAAPLRMPELPAAILGQVDARAARLEIQDWLASDPRIAALRETGSWNNISDRVALFSAYARSAEHSAQQPSDRLRLYERDFRAGRINILNCSTTMEMGVDIGSVSSVMMTNTPPGVANYRQRVGRAGRRGQATALAFTFCKDRPLDREAFRDPGAYLARTTAAPRVALNSRPIAQRHANAWLLGAFLKARAGDVLKMESGFFFGCPEDPAASRPPKEERPAEAFALWLAAPSTREAQTEALKTILRRSILEGAVGALDDAAEALARVRLRFEAQWEGLRLLAREEAGGRKAARTRMGLELKRLTGEFLLSRLAEYGFLPGHGFPTDVVTFLPGRVGPEAGKDGGRHMRAEGPQRSLDLAIRDYAPGSEVVLDGLVHRSAGVTLNWRRPPAEDQIPDVQSLRRHWRCGACAATGTLGGAEEAVCSSCGARPPRLKIQEFLRPAGFTVDPRRFAHADTDLVSYVPPEPPAISAGEAIWRPLPHPELGRMRFSREGLVYYANLGPQRQGYALCLHCGRAEPGGVEALAGHRPLRWRKGEAGDLCEGNRSPWKIRSNLALGHEIVTDVAELQPAHPLTAPAAAALVVALREGLARELGVDADEMGFAAQRSVNAWGAEAASILLFDRAAGGAGFATSLEERLPEALRRAEALLDCATPGCETACAACVLTSDAPEGPDSLDRKAALAFLRAHLRLPESLAPEHRFTPEALPSFAPLDEIDRALSQRGGRIAFLLAEDFDPGALEDWPAAAALGRWTHQGRAARLAVSASALARLSLAEALALRSFALRRNLEIFRLEAEPPDPFVFACVEPAEAPGGEEAPPLLWRCGDAAARRPGPLWGASETQPSARGRAPFALTGASLDPEALAPPRDAAFRLIERGLDGPSLDFGARVARLLAGALEEAGASPGVVPGGAVRELEYRDSYVNSPLAAKLLVSVAAALCDLGKSGAGKDGARPRLILRTPGPRQSSLGPPWRVQHDWETAADQKQVFEALAAASGLDGSLIHEAVPHGRFLEMRLAEGARFLVILDQGFGAWSPPSSLKIRHDFGLPPAAQAADLRARNFLLERTRPGLTYLIAVRLS